MRINIACDGWGAGQISIDFPHRKDCYELSHVRLTEEQANQEARLINVYMQVKDTQTYRFVDEPNMDPKLLMKNVKEAILLNTRCGTPKTHIANALLVLRAWERQHTF